MPKISQRELSALEVFSAQYGVVVFQNCGFRLAWQSGHFRITKMIYLSSFESEVVGNIHEDSELLEEK